VATAAKLSSHEHQSGAMSSVPPTDFMLALNVLLTYRFYGSGREIFRGL